MPPLSIFSTLFPAMEPKPTIPPWSGEAPDWAIDTVPVSQTDIPLRAQPLQAPLDWDSFKAGYESGQPPPDKKPDTFTQPQFQYPYPEAANEQEMARNALAEIQWNIAHPQNKDKGVKGFLKELVQNFGAGMASAPEGSSVKARLAAGGIGAGAGAVNRTMNEKRKLERELPAAYNRAQIADKQAYQDAQLENIKADNERQRTQARGLSEWRKSETARKTDDRLSRERTSRMNAVAGMFKNIPVYDPADPQFAEMTAALGDVNLPITKKDAKKKVDLKQDQRTGAWTVILTDPITGKQEARNVMKDGKPFASTPTVVMQGEYGMFKQNDQQEYQAGQNQLDRDQRQMQFLLGYQAKVAEMLRSLANDQRKAAEWKAAETRRIHEAIGAGRMTQEVAEQMMQALQQ